MTRRFKEIAALAILLGSCRETEQEARQQKAETQNEAEAKGRESQARSEIPDQQGQGPFVGAVLNANHIPIFVAYREVDGDAVTGGDMVLGSHQQMQAQVRQLLNAVDPDTLSPEQRALAEQARAQLGRQEKSFARAQSPASLARMLGWGTLGTLWPARVVPYDIDASIPEGVRRDNIRTAIANWNGQAPIRIRLRSEMTPEEIGNTATLRFRDHSNADHTFACSSNVGYQPSGGVQRVNLNPSCGVGNIMHEIGHAMGFHHEHQRTDRESIFTTTASMPNDPVNYGELSGRNLSGHDLCSIMHYSPRTTTPAWFTLTQAGDTAFQGCRAALPANCQSIGQRCQLSATDRTSLAAMYPARP